MQEGTFYLADVATEAHRLPSVHPIIENHVLHGHPLSAAARLGRSFRTFSVFGRLPRGKAFCHASSSAGEDLSRT